MTDQNRSKDLPDRPTPAEARDYLSRQPNPVDSLRLALDRFILDRTARKGPLVFEED